MMQMTNIDHGGRLAGRLVLATVLLAGLVGMADAAEPEMVTPGIPGEGPIHPLPDAAYQPKRDATYKVVFALTRAGDTPQDVSPSLLRVARTVNLYVSAGVPLNHLKFVAVAYGPATPSVLDDEHYKAKFNVPNPNLALIHKLHAAGVDVAVCGQAVIESKFEYAWIAKDVTLSLSALTTITVLQQQGYALMPL
jgi:intracellular sulfur oxidation DsrE/DsrF family protein